MKILFVHQGLASFVQKDLDILHSTHEVRPIQFTGRKGLAKHLIPDLWQLWRGVIWCDLTFSWFGKLHAFFAVLFSRILGKKAIVVAGGDDVGVYVYEGRPYPLPVHPIKKWFTRFIFGGADRVLAVSQFSLNDAVNNAKAKLDRIIMLYHGFPSDVFHSSTKIHKERIAVTVGEISEENFERKGFRLFVECAKLLPGVPFVVVGPAADKAIERLKIIAPSNVIFTGGLYGKDLVQQLAKAMIYVQASGWESFGCSLAEAMLCECVPVVSNLTALPEVVGDCGFYLDKLEPEELAAKIRTALEHPEMGKKARQRIVEHFPLEKRKQAILEVIRRLT